MERLTQLDERMHRFIGAFLGDGWVRKNTRLQGYSLDLAIGKADELHTADYLSLLQSLFPAVKWRNNSKGAFGLTATNKAVHQFICSLGIGGTSHEKRVPQCVFSSSQADQIELLAGYIDADGSVSANAKNRGRTTLCAVNAELISDLRRICQACGIPVTTAKTEYRSTNYADHTVYRCVLSGRGAANIPLWHRSKAGRLWTIRK